MTRKEDVMNRVVCLCALLVAGAVSIDGSACGATLTIDRTTTYQTMDGFGACSDRMAKWKVKQGPFYADIPFDGQWDTIAGDLGMTCIRTLVSGEFADAIAPQTVEHVTELHARGIDKFWTSILSPPASMKSNNDVANGGRLLPEFYDDFAAMVVQYCNTFKTTTGVDLWGISLQNELAFVEPYASCVYNASEYKAVVEVVVPAMRQAGLTTRLLGAEHMLWGFPQYEGPLMLDPATEDYLDRFILHSYLHDVNPIPADQSVQDWQNAAAFSTAKGRGLWMSETSGYDTTWDGALELASYMYVTLKHGTASGWVYLNISTWNGTENCLLRPYGYSPLGAVSKHFYRYIRPGAVMVECTDYPDSSLFAVAFEHPDSGSVTIVVINSGSAARTVDLAGDGLPAQYDVYRSTENEACVPAGTSTGSVSCPARSVTTLYSTQGQAVRPSRHCPVQSAPRPGTPSAAFSLDGRRISAQTSPASGVVMYRLTTGESTAHAIVGRRDTGTNR